MVRRLFPLFFGLLTLWGAPISAQVKPFFAEVKLQPVPDSGRVRGEVLYHFTHPSQSWIFLEERGARIEGVFSGSRIHWTRHELQRKAGSLGWESTANAGDTLQARILFTLEIQSVDGRVQVGPGSAPALPGLQGFWGFPVSDWLVKVPGNMGLETLLEGDFSVTKKGVRWVGLKLYASRPASETWVRWTGWPKVAPLPIAAVEPAPKEPEVPVAVVPKVATLPVVTPQPTVKKEVQSSPEIPTHEPEEEGTIALAGKSAQLPPTGTGELTLVFPASVDTLPSRARFTDEQNRFWDTWERLAVMYPLPPADEAWDHLQEVLGQQAYELGALTYGQQDVAFLNAYVLRVSQGDEHLLPLFANRLDSLALRDSLRGEERLARVYLAKAAGQTRPPFSAGRWVHSLDELRIRTDASAVDSLVDAQFERSILSGFEAATWLEVLPSLGDAGLEASERISGGSWPNVRLSYRYVSADSTWFIEETQVSESAKNKAYTLSYGFGSETREIQRMAGGPLTTIKAEGPVFWAFPDAEQTTGIRFTGKVPGSFLLSQASRNHRFIIRFAALEQLMRDGNAARQALGVSMGLQDDSPMLRQLALDRAPGLPAHQRAKVLPALKKMAESDPMPGLKQQADALYHLFNRN